MKLIKLELTNYRRFMGYQQIDFAHGEKNVTIIRAENGAGKTGILMALLFGLFGVVSYDQFRVSQNEDDIMVSRYLFSDSEDKQSFKCTVCVEFEDDGIKYRIERAVTAQKINNVIRQDNNNIETVLKIDGIKSKMSKKDIDIFMNNLIGENIRGFLFFDGVRYMDLFQKNNTSSKKEIQSIIEKMLNISDLDRTVSALKNVQKTYCDTSSTKMKTIEADKMNELTRATKRCESLENEIDELEKRIDNNKVLREKQLQINLENNKDKKLIDKYNENLLLIENAKCSLQSVIQFFSKDRYMSSVLSNLVGSIFREEVIDDFNLINSSDDRTSFFIEQILISNKCVCCDDDEQLTEKQKYHLNKMLNKIKNEEKYSSSVVECANSVTKALSIDKPLYSIKELIEKLKSAIDLYEEYERIKISLESKAENVNIKELSDEIEKGLQTLGGYDGLIKRDLDELEIKKYSLEEENKKRDSIQEELDSIRRQIAVINNTQEKFDLLQRTIDKLVDLRKNYLESAQKNISERANEFFFQLLSSDDKKSYKKLLINSSYGIEVYDVDGKSVFPDLSAGQKLLSSMAFTMGLTAEASNAKPTCNFPLVMDTPMSNLDASNRERLIKIMPKVVNQWILTPMDTELTDNEILYFERTNKVGKTYQLIKTDRYSKIIPYDDINDLKGGIR